MEDENVRVSRLTNEDTSTDIQVNCDYNITNDLSELNETVRTGHHSMLSDRVQHADLEATGNFGKLESTRAE